MLKHFYGQEGSQNLYHAVKLLSFRGIALRYNEGDQISILHELLARRYGDATNRDSKVNNITNLKEKFYFLWN